MAHDRRLPRRGHIGIFNRSYYEETLVVRVHQNILAKQQLPSELVTKNIWRERFEDINAYERYLARQGVLVRKFFLHVSKDEQRKRFLERLDKPEKHWKFSPADVGEREHFADYMTAYEDMIRHTATDVAPWYVVPADRKWFTRLVVLGGDHRRDSIARSALPRGRSESARRVQAGEGGARGARSRPKARKDDQEGQARSEAVLVAGRGRALRPVSRSRMGPAGRRRPAAVREDLPRRLSVRA